MTMGKEGHYELFPGSGIWLPNSGTLIDAATGGALDQVAQGLAESEGVQQGAITAAGNKLGQKIVRFYSEQPIIAIGSTIAIGSLVAFGIFKVFSK